MRSGTTGTRIRCRPLALVGCGPWVRTPILTVGAVRIGILTHGDRRHSFGDVVNEVWNDWNKDKMPPPGVGRMWPVGQDSDPDSWVRQDWNPDPRRPPP